MATTKLYLDKRTLKQDGTAPIKVAINQNGKTSLFPIGISINPSNWDKEKCRVIGLSSKNALNGTIYAYKYEIDTIVQSPQARGLTAQELKKLVEKIIRPEKTEKDESNFLDWYRKFLSKKINRTWEIYNATLNKLLQYDSKIESLSINDIDHHWLEDFDQWLSNTSVANSRAIHMRNIRAVFNYAIDEEITTNYPFRKFKIKHTVTRKRSYDVEELRSILFADVPEWCEKYKAFFALTFCLIGINTIDLCGLTRITKGRVEYCRAKTKRLYSIKLEPEAIDILNKYKGGEHLLNFLDGYVDYRHFYNNLCVGLAEVKKIVGVDELTTYWARHTWATIASELDIPKDIIAAALGHGGNSVTDIYIDFNQKKIDEANRKVLDYVFHNKR